MKPNETEPERPTEDGEESKPAAGDWLRPAPAARDTHMQAWLIFLAAIFLLIALWVPVRAVYQRYRYLPPPVDGPRDAKSFIALAYRGVSDEKGDISPRQFEEHVAALRRKGYVPISLKDVQAFYEEGKWLPRRSVLLTFEQSRKSSYFETRETLRRYRWRAVMFVWTQPMRMGEPSSLRWPYLRDMAFSGSWELAAQSDRGFDMIASDEFSGKGPFFSTPEWMPTRRRFETPEEMGLRFKSDHEKVLAEFQSELGQLPLAFAFPYGDYGQYDERARLTRRINLDLVGRLYKIGFVSGKLGLNTMESDRRCLNRLLVETSWSGAELVHRLEQLWPVENLGTGEPFVFGIDSWVDQWGSCAAAPEGLHLRATPDTTGAKAWLAGSDYFRDGLVRIVFRIEEGQFGVFLRSSSDGESGIYLGVSKHGQLWLRQKFAGLEQFTLASANSLMAPGEDHELVVRLRNRMCFVRLDGKALFREGAVLQGEARAGMIGVSVWSPEKGQANVVVKDVRFVNQRSALAVWTPEVAQAPHLANWLNDNAYRFTAICPPWLDVYHDTPLVMPLWDNTMLHLLANTYDLMILPRITIREPRQIASVSSADLVDEMVRLKTDGVFVDCNNLSQAEVAMTLNWISRLQQQMEKHAMKLSVRFPPKVMSLAAFSSMLAMLPGALVASDGPLMAGLNPTNAVAVESVPTPPTQMDLGLYYQIADLLDVGDQISIEARNEELRQKGFTAFQSGDYDAAIKCWTEWAEVSPSNEGPLMLIGDAYLRKNDPAKAAEFYEKSLALNPGQVGLAIRRSRLLEAMGRDDDARQILNLYARTFPANADVVIAQAGWLDRHRRRDAARDLVRKLVEDAPDNIESRIALQSFLDLSAERYANMRSILALGAKPGSEQAFGQALQRFELLSQPEASVFLPFIVEMATTAPSPVIRQLYADMLPRETAAVEDFSTGRLSDEWFASGGFRPLERGRYELKAGSEQAEAYLRLKRSELLRDGYIDVSLDESVGFFWIYARRSSRSMVRFGFDASGVIYIQSWRNGDIVTQDSRPWIRPPGTLKLRFELRGDGARGFVNGAEIFPAALAIPNDICFGWWGIAPFASELGMARVRIGRIEGGPLPPAIAIVPPVKEGDRSASEKALEDLRPYMTRLSAVAPVWFRQKADGSVDPQPEEQGDLARMLAGYYRLRLLPVVDLPFRSEVPTEQIIACARSNNLAGVLVRCRMMPGQEWFDRMQQMLETNPVNVIVMRWPANPWDHVPIRKDMDASNVKVVPKDNTLIPDLLPGSTNSMDCIFREMMVGNPLLAPRRIEWPSRVNASEKDIRDARWSPLTPRVILLDAKNTNAISRIGKP